MSEKNESTNMYLTAIPLFPRSHTRERFTQRRSTHLAMSYTHLFGAIELDTFLSDAHMAAVASVLIGLAMFGLFFHRKFNTPHVRGPSHDKSPRRTEG